MASSPELRERNLGLVLREICAGVKPGACAPARAQIAVRTGLHKTTVSQLTDELLAAGLVIELDPVAANRSGRPTLPLAPAPGRLAAIGLEVNVEYLGLKAIDLTGAILAERVDLADLRLSRPDEVLERLGQLTLDVIARLERIGTSVAGVGLALPGLTTTARGELALLNAPNLGWRGIDLAPFAALLDRRPDHPPESPCFGSGHLPEPRGQDSARASTSGSPGQLVLDNEANLAARAEARLAGPDPAERSFVYLSAESGIGAGLVSDAALITGLHGWAGEIGHVTVDPSGPVCTCGARGCLEVYAGRRAIARVAGLAGPALPAEVLATLANSPAAARRFADQVVPRLAAALSSVLNLLDLSQVVLGGDYAVLSPVLAEPLRTALNARVLAARWGGAEVRVRPARELAAPAMTGAAWAVLESVLANPAPHLTRPFCASSLLAHVDPTV
ncbi:MAG: ROK family protein [Bifidobacteriaceae bacterium]|jgi:predicted NBD/HSP70 family sugar kinase|nr:ROK family protein [Bifidobacteriaceae bacterium]